MTDQTITVGELRDIAASVAAAIDPGGESAAARMLVEASRAADDPEGLLEVRSALIETRSVWERVVDGELRAKAHRALAAAKRLAIELD